ncbi:MAG: hypothetical protein IPG82_18095 [Saprospiraceae bacterium]|nr:hypothetical protein [Saprospiraceae bacterium]
MLSLINGEIPQCQSAWLRVDHQWKSYSITKSGSDRDHVCLVDGEVTKGDHVVPEYRRQDRRNG